jgi:septum formation protein
MRELSPEYIDDYLVRAGDAVLSSVGAYQVEGLGAQLFSRIEGDYFSILGIPLLPVLDFLRVRGVIAT